MAHYIVFRFVALYCSLSKLFCVWCHIRIFKFHSRMIVLLYCTQVRTSNRTVEIHISITALIYVIETHTHSYATHRRHRCHLHILYFHLYHLIHHLLFSFLFILPYLTPPSVYTTNHHVTQSRYCIQCILGHLCVRNRCGWQCVSAVTCRYARNVHDALRNILDDLQGKLSLDCNYLSRLFCCHTIYSFIFYYTNLFIH